MNEPEPFCRKVHLKAYPTAELGGIVWAYLGPPERTPALPKFAWTEAPPSHRHVSKVIQECNWLQALEGGLDTSHAPIMHRLLADDAGRGGIKPSSAYVRAKAPSIVVDITDYGYRYAGIRALGEAESHIRVYHYILPFHQIRASRSERGNPIDAGHIWVPIDDENTMVYNWAWSVGEAPLGDQDRLERGLGNGPAHVDQTTFRSKPNRANNYLIDRAVQRRLSFTGIDGVNVQDRAIQETMGRIVDRSREHLGPADKAIIQLRKLLRRAVDTAVEGGTPAGIAPSYYRLRASETIVPRAADWRPLAAEGLAREAILETV
jgi:phenylpropionate dioxygenase-like ring-hydroxylating dioxygenase large terminal subunit